MPIENINDINRLADFTGFLEKKCHEKGIGEIYGFHYMPNYDSSIHVEFAYQMDIKKLLDARINGKLESGNNTYTGFIIGNAFGWRPISLNRLSKLLRKWDYEITQFILEFEEKIYKSK